MFSSPRTSSPLLHSLLTRIASLSLFAGAGLFAHAQTAPQLLPYTIKLVAGGGSAAIAAGATCPVSGYTATDAFGDGCLATEIELGNTAPGGTTPGARSAVADSKGNVFFTDYANALVRRVDAGTGIVTAVAGGGATAAGTSVAALGTAVKLVHPAGIAFAPNGDLYFSDPGNGQVFKVAATAGFITTSGVIKLVAGSPAGTFGYAASTSSSVVTVANSNLRAVYGLAFDSLGDLFMSDEYYYAILGLNTNPTGTNTVNNVALPAGQIWKIAGTTTGATAPYCVNGTTTTAGCTSGVYATGVQANADMIRGVYSVAADGKGNLFSGEEYYNAVFGINAAGVVSTVAGIPNNAAKTVKRAPAGSFGIGSVFGVAADTLSNVYFTDASNGVIWRVDAAGKLQYPVAGGATTFCAAATDAYGDGCPALQAKIGSSGSNNFASTTLPGPGAYGISVDANANLLFGDTETNLIREVASGTQFGNVGGNQSTTQTLDIHFAASDVAASGAPYTITAGASIFTLGTATCTTNPDATTDCLLPLTATPTTLGAFSGTLQVKSSLGGVASFALGGTAISTPVTRTSISYTAGSVCAGTSTYSTATPVTFVATITSTGSPTGTVQFLANGVNIGTPQAVSGGMATLTGFLFSNPGAYKVTAIYSGDTYFKASTSVTPATLSTAAPSFSTAANTGMQSTVAAGQTSALQLQRATERLHRHHHAGMLRSARQRFLLVQPVQPHGHRLLRHQHGSAQHPHPAGDRRHSRRLRRKRRRMVVCLQHRAGHPARAPGRPAPARLSPARKSGLAACRDAACPCPGSLGNHRLRKRRAASAGHPFRHLHDHCHQHRLYRHLIRAYPAADR